MINYLRNYVKVTMAYGFVRYIIENEGLEINHKKRRHLLTEKLGVGIVSAVITPVTFPFITYLDLIHIECKIRNVSKPKWYEDLSSKLL